MPRINPIRLRHARFDAGLRTEEVAVAPRAAHSSVVGYEAGAITPSAPRMLALAELYRVTVEQLCSDDEPVGAQ